MATTRGADDDNEDEWHKTTRMLTLMTIMLMMLTGIENDYE